MNHAHDLQYDIAVTGGGASGMMAAVCAALNGARVCILEKNDRAGKKILKTGNGRCNLTHDPLDADSYRGSGAARVKEYLDRFGTSDTLEFFKKLGLLTRNRDGYVYPYSETASAVLDVLRFAVRDAGVDLITSTEAAHVVPAGKGFLIKCRQTGEDGKIRNIDISASKVILSAGGCADPVSGSDGSGFAIARELGLKVIKPLPALVKVRVSDDAAGGATGDARIQSLAGVRAKGVVSIDGTDISDAGEIQFTKDGLSGIPVFNISRYISRMLDEGGRVTVKLDLMPEMGTDELVSFISSLKCNTTAEEMFGGVIHKKINAYIFKRLGASAGMSADLVDPALIQSYSKLIKELDFDVSSTGTFEEAQVTAGGVDFAEVDPDLQCIDYPGLYLTGEILDTDGPCGGYNLQWAWTSGYIAGQSAWADGCGAGSHSAGKR